MTRNFSPVVLCTELANLDKDADSRKSAMRALESYVKEMDSGSIPLFLSQLSEIRETGTLSEEFGVSLYEVLARAHGVDIIPHIDSIVEAIVRTLGSSGGSFHLQQACSKVIPAIARYCIDPVTAEDKKRDIVHRLCNPLCESLLGSQESLSAGAALCLKALVDSDNWQFASDAMVNKVSLNVAVVLDAKSNQTNTHMGLVMALAKKNALTVEAYARLLIASGLRILNAGAKECNSQKRLSAIQMVNFLMKSLDPRSVYSELDLIVEEIGKYESADQMAFVNGAASEALQTARRIIAEKERKSERDSTPKSKSNFVNSSRRNYLGCSNQSPESHSLGSLSGSDSPLGLPNTPSQVSSELDCDNRSVKQRVRRFENGLVDVSLRDGLFSELSRGNDGYTNSENCRSQETDDHGGNCSEEFTGFALGSPLNGEVSESLTPSPRSQEMDHSNGGNSSEEIVEFVQESASNGADSRSLTPSLQRLSSKFYIGNTHMFTSPRINVHSLQHTSHSNSGSSEEKQSEMFTSSPSSKCDCSQTGSNDFNAYLSDPNGELVEQENGNEHLGVEQIQFGSESVLSTDTAAAAGLMHQLVILDDKKIKQTLDIKTQRRSYTRICSILFLLLAVIISLLWINDNKEVRHVVPT
ncbi:hypothetical protein CRG98_045536 [Punica granatum]|uniref:TORTIFOLIA1/SINE1-2 N-terminal domain-containing protein n=1 Tax=Punica granatum TaxID=22663 RepID=A0A2I0HQT9_PUNGR|nr:hypothetical protein CRG98_045536 [Punica granatum]